MASSTELSTTSQTRVVEPARAGAPDVHAGALPDRVEPLQDLHAVGPVGPVRLRQTRRPFDGSAGAVGPGSAGALEGRLRRETLVRAPNHSLGSLPAGVGQPDHRGRVPRLQAWAPAEVERGHAIRAEKGLEAGQQLRLEERTWVAMAGSSTARTSRPPSIRIGGAGRQRLADHLAPAVEHQVTSPACARSCYDRAGRTSTKGST